MTQPLGVDDNRSQVGLFRRFWSWIFGVEDDDVVFRTYLRYNAGSGVATVVAVGLHAAIGSPETELFAYALVVGMSAFWTGGIVGFLFGVPVQSRGTDGRDTPFFSTRLGEVADWLTKIVIGVGLIEIRAIGDLVVDIGESIGSQTAVENDAALFSALVVALAAIGFWFLYYWSWMYWPRLHDKMQRGLDSGSGETPDDEKS